MFYPMYLISLLSLSRGQGHEAMNRRWIIIIAIVVFMVLVVLVTGRGFGPSQTAQAPSSISYANAITGQTATDIIGESGDLTPGGTVNPPTVTIDGIDNIYSYLT